MSSFKWNFFINFSHFFTSLTYFLRLIVVARTAIFPLMQYVVGRQSASDAVCIFRVCIISSQRGYATDNNGADTIATHFSSLLSFQHHVVCLPSVNIVNETRDLRCYAAAARLKSSFAESKTQEVYVPAAGGILKRLGYK